MAARANRQRRLPLPAWPPADRSAWEAATRVGGLLDDDGATAHLSAVTLNDLSNRYSYLLDFADQCGRLNGDGPAAATVTAELITDYIAWLEPTLSSVTIAQSLWKIGRVAGMLAPERDWSWLRRAQRRREAMAVPRDKRHLVVDSGSIVDAGFALMDQAETNGSHGEFARAELYRDGLMIALLALMPLRMANFATLEIGRTLQRQGTVWTIVIPAAEAKSRRAGEGHLAVAIGNRVTQFVETFRPTYRGSQRHARLWPSRHGGPLSYNAVYKAIFRRTEAAFGHPLNPHLFRDCATTTIAVHHGDRIGIIPGLLGHRDPRTFERYYNQAGMISAVHAYQNLIAELTEE